MFCPKCGSILVPKKKGSKTVLVCNSCGHAPANAKAVLKEKLKKEKVNVEVVDKEVEPLSLTDATCPKCGHDKAYYWFLQTRASDEAETQFLKCEKCKHQWRVYD